MTYIEKLYMWMVIMPIVTFVVGNMWASTGIKKEEVK